MRLRFSAILSLCLASSSLATPGLIPKDANKGVTTPVLDEDVIVNTIFNSKEVPPMIDISGTTMKEDISKGYWCVFLRPSP